MIIKHLLAIFQSCSKNENVSTILTRALLMSFSEPMPVQKERKTEGHWLTITVYRWHMVVSGVDCICNQIVTGCLVNNKLETRTLQAVAELFVLLSIPSILLITIILSDPSPPPSTQHILSAPPALNPYFWLALLLLAAFHQHLGSVIRWMVPR